MIKHAWHALRYGDWSAGWDDYGNDPFLSWTSLYYDGHHKCARIGKLWFGVSY